MSGNYENYWLSFWVLEIMFFRHLFYTLNSIKYTCLIKTRSVAQLVEQLTLNQQVQGLSYCRPT